MTALPSISIEQVTWRDAIADPRAPIALRTRVLRGVIITPVLMLACGLSFALLNLGANSDAVLTPRGALRVVLVAAGMGALVQVGAVVGLRLPAGALRWCWMAVVRGGLPFALLMRTADVAHADPTLHSLGSLLMLAVPCGLFFALFQSSHEIQALGAWPQSAAMGTAPTSP